ncbi:zincin [Rhodotorula sp. JG-1b]|nr:zincin [Rhodotorula sp. JG-1b]
MSAPRTRDEEEQEPLLAGEQARPPAAGDEDLPAEWQPESLGSRIRTALRSPGRLNGLEKALAAAFLIALLLVGLFAGLFGGEVVKYKHYKHKHQHEYHPPPPPGRPTATVTASTLYPPGPTGKPIPPPAPAPPRKHPKDPNSLCLTSDCVRSAATILSGLDTSIDPCTDFYEYANGGWLDSHPIPPGKASFSVMADIADRNRRVIQRVLERDPESEKDRSEADRDNLAHLRAFWTSCNDEAALDKVGSEPLYAIADEAIKLWRGGDAASGSADDDDDDDDEAEWLMQADGTPYEAENHHHKKHKKDKNHHPHGRWDPKTKRTRLTNALAYLHSRGVGALFDTAGEGDVGADPKDVVLWLSQSGLGLPSKDYYGDKAVVKKYQKALAVVLDEVYSSRDEQAMTGLAADVVRLEKELAQISLDLDKLSEPGPTYNPYNATALQDLFPSVSFGDYFASLGPRPRFPEPVIVTSPEYFGNLTRILDAVAPDVLEAYFVSQVGFNFASLLGAKQSIRRAEQKFGNSLTGVDTLPPRTEVCLDLLDNSLGFSVGRYFVEEAFPGESKKYGEEVIRSIIQAFQDRLPGRSWLDQETRDKAKEKVQAIEYKIGYPLSPDTTKAESIRSYYQIQMPVRADDFFGNVVRAQIADEKRKWASIGRPKNRDVWEMNPQEVNAYFSPEDNQIVFPAGILQTPFFNVDWPEYLVWGAFGSVAGHELTHSLDQSGRQYDKDGRLVDWWSEETNKRFLERQKCFRRQYAGYNITGPDGRSYPINSRYTGGEDGADSGGIAQAYDAWQARRNVTTTTGHGNDTGAAVDRKNWLLPGLDEYTREQMFFIAYAQGWARATTRAEDVRRIRVDPHSPTRFRVIGPLSNDEAFAKAFNCPAGSPMNRGEDRCELW